MPTFKTVKASGEHRPNVPRFHSDHCASIFIVTAWWRRHAGPKADDASMLVHTGLSPSPALVACENENIDNLDLLTSLDSMNSADTMYSYQRIEDSVKPPSPEHNSESYEQIFTDPTISVIVFSISVLATKNPLDKGTYVLIYCSYVYPLDISATLSHLRALRSEK